MRIAYGELIGGLSGDMFVAALLDAGVPLSRLEKQLRKLPGLTFELRTRKKLFHSVRARQFRVICADRERHRSWKTIRALIRRSGLPSEVKERGLAMFSRLAAAEAKIHGVAIDDVHFHEVGATDSIVDFMAAAVGISELGIEALHFSPVPLGRGLTRSTHGPLPLPGPATLELLEGVPVFGIDLESETVTPTGAAILATLGRSFGNQPFMTLDKVGYGGGRKEFANRPNLFRLTVGTVSEGAASEEMLLVETNIDDMNPQLYDHVMELLFQAGARDVFLAPIQMKKNRPAIRLSVICDEAHRNIVARILFQETTTIGLRYHGIRRLVLPRTSKTIKTRFGAVGVKVVVLPDGTTRGMPEYADLKRIAAVKRVPFKSIYEETLRVLRSAERSNIHAR